MAVDKITKLKKSTQTTISRACAPPPPLDIVVRHRAAPWYPNRDTHCANLFINPSTPHCVQRVSLSLGTCLPPKPYPA